MKPRGSLIVVSVALLPIVIVATSIFVTRYDPRCSRLLGEAPRPELQWQRAQSSSKKELSPTEVARLFGTTPLPARGKGRSGLVDSVVSHSSGRPPGCTLHYVARAAGPGDQDLFLFKDVMTGRILPLSPLQSRGGWRLLDVSDAAFVLSDGHIKCEISR